MSVQVVLLVENEEAPLAKANCPAKEMLGVPRMKQKR